MATFVAQSTLDIIAWVLRASKEDDIPVSPLKMHCLLFIFQGIYGAVNPLKKLMPATFVTSSKGPIEPNIFKMFSNSYPPMAAPSLDPSTTDLLQRLWNRFGHHQDKFLTDKIVSTPSYQNINKKGPRTEITYEDIVATFQEQKEKFDTTLSTNGKLVKKWLPKQKSVTK